MFFNIVSPAKVANELYDLVIIGSGFGSSFFLSEALKHEPGRVLVLEWGQYNPWTWQIENRTNSPVSWGSTFVNTTPEKPWNTTIGFGGGTNCWFGQTPRFHPNDFKLKSLYGVGKDWPISYADLEPYYCEAEEIMQVAGDSAMGAVLPRSKPFPLPAHKGSTPDRIMMQATPDTHFIMPTARASRQTDTRTKCCANLTCNLCPVQAKFSAINGFKREYADGQVDICFNAEVVRLNSDSNHVSSLIFSSEGQEHQVKAESFVLGANGIQSPAILLRSGMDYAETGKRLHEQYSISVEAYLDGVGNFDGSTITTGLNYSLADGEFRKRHSSVLVAFENRWTRGFRPDVKRLTETLPMLIVADNIPSTDNFVGIDANSGKAVVTHLHESKYAKDGIKNALDKLPSLLSPLPVEKIFAGRLRGSESHVQGTLRMGLEGDGSIVDRNQIHHKYRNLIIVGSSVFATCSPANPSLTISALSIRAARNYYRSSREGEET